MSQDTLESVAPESNPAPAPLNPTRLTIIDAVRALRTAGSSQVTVESLRADLAAGAPTNPDGTINLVHYTAWLIREMARGD